MVVCKFFLQGGCRFGENCKFEHPYNDNQHISIIRQQTFNPIPNGGTAAPVDTATLVRSVSNDMNLLEKSGQWLLSCYAPFKEKSLFPGFEDHSCEEIRYGYYNAKSNGTTDAYVQQLNMLLQDVMMKVISLQNPTQEAISVMRTIFDENVQPAPNSFMNSTPVFESVQNSVFDTTTANTGAFRQPSSMGNTSIFNANTQQQNSSAQSIFAAANKSLFTGSQIPEFRNANQSIFVNTQQSNSPLGQPFQQVKTLVGDAGFQPTSLFNKLSSNSNSQFPSTTQNSPLLTTQQQQTIPSIFNIQSNASNLPLIGQQNINTPITIPVSQNTLFNSTSSPDGTQQTQATPSLPNARSIFSSNISGNNFSVKSVGVVDDSIYSKLEELSESDIKSYAADAFEFGKVPEKPPHISMC